MSQRIEVCRAGSIAHPQAFLTCGFEAGIVALTFRPQGVSPFKVETAAVNGKPVIIGNGLVFRAAPVLLAVIPAFVAAGTNTGLGLAEGAAVFLPDSPSAIGGLAIFVHGEPCLADRITGRKRFQDFRAAWIEGNKRLTLIDRFYRIVDAFRIVALIAEEGTPLQREDLVGCGKDVNGNCGIHDVGWGGQFVERQPGDAVHQHMTFVPPVELVPALIVLVGGRMDAEGTVRIAFRVVFLGELVLCEGFWVVLPGVCHDGRGIQANK